MSSERSLRYVEAAARISVPFAVHLLRPGLAIHSISERLELAGIVIRRVPEKPTTD